MAKEMACDSIFCLRKSPISEKIMTLDTSDICMMKDADDISQPDILVRQEAQRQSRLSKEAFWEKKYFGFQKYVSSCVLIYL